MRVETTSQEKMDVTYEECSASNPNVDHASRILSQSNLSGSLLKLLVLRYILVAFLHNERSFHFRPKVMIKSKWSSSMRSSSTRRKLAHSFSACVGLESSDATEFSSCQIAYFVPPTRRRILFSVVLRYKTRTVLLYPERYPSEDQVRRFYNK